MPLSAPLLECQLPGLPKRQGKVRDVFDLGEKLLMVATDRISAFDWVMPTGIPDKGKILTQLSLFWFEKLGVPNHLLSTDVASLELPSGGTKASELAGRSMIVKKARVVPIECVARGYLEGSGWKEYQQSQTVCGIKLPAGLKQCSALPEPIFTPATKEESGHDINISFEQMAGIVGHTLAQELRDRTLDVYRSARDHAAKCGIIIADTKLEWGHHGGELILVDEVLTPDSSRFWPASKYAAGQLQPSFDKQFLRSWLETTSWDKNSTPPQLPDDVVATTRDKYAEAFRLLTGKAFSA